MNKQEALERKIKSLSQTLSLELELLKLSLLGQKVLIASK